LGLPIVNHLVENGFTVQAVDLRVHPNLPVPVRVVNLLNRETCYEFLAGADAVVHLGNYSETVLADHQRLFIENSAMNMNVFQAACELKVRKIVFASSIQVVSGSRRRHQAPGTPSVLQYLPLDGDTPAQPGSPYAASKAAAEVLLGYYSRTHGMDCVAIRFPWVLDTTRLEGDLDPQWVPGNVDEALTCLDFTDAATLIGNVLRANLPGFRVYLPARLRPANNWPVARAIQELYPTVPLRMPAAEMQSLVDTSRITMETGWTLTKP
jgi:nucleoside-diphosphate-sugar epimerase